MRASKHRNLFGVEEMIFQNLLILTENQKFKYRWFFSFLQLLLRIKKSLFSYFYGNLPLKHIVSTFYKVKI